MEYFNIGVFVCVYLVLLLASGNNANLSPYFYSRSCPNLQKIVRRGMEQALFEEPRMGASILRLFFHDCFVNGCDASILLDDRESFIGEKNAYPNRNSLRGFEVIDSIKSRVEWTCNGIVSCADILAIAARDAVFLLGGPSWEVALGRRDATTTSQEAANTNLPPPFTNLTTLISLFASMGLTAQDMTALSGAHTLGHAQCTTFRAHIYSDNNIDPNFARTRRATCPEKYGSGDTELSPLDRSPNRFDNGYFQDLVAKRGLLHSDQELFNGGSQDSLVRLYSCNYTAFANDFVSAMIKLGNISPINVTNGEIRKNCWVVN